MTQKEGFDERGCFEKWNAVSDPARSPFSAYYQGAKEQFEQSQAEVTRVTNLLTMKAEEIQAKDAEIARLREALQAVENIAPRILTEALNLKHETATSADLKPKTDIEGGG